MGNQEKVFISWFLCWWSSIISDVFASIFKAVTTFVNEVGSTPCCEWNSEWYENGLHGCQCMQLSHYAFVLLWCRCSCVGDKLKEKTRCKLFLAASFGAILCFFYRMNRLDWRGYNIRNYNLGIYILWLPTKP